MAWGGSSYNESSYTTVKNRVESSTSTSSGTSSSSGSSGGSSTSVTVTKVETRPDGSTITYRSDGTSIVTIDGRNFRLGAGENATAFISDYLERGQLAVDERLGRETTVEPTVPTVTTDNNLMALIQSLLDQFGLATPAMLDFVKNSIAKGWKYDQVIMELRRQPDYLANPLFKANIERAKAGLGFMAEGEVIRWGADAKNLATRFGYKAPPDSYLAKAFQGNLSLSEIEHRFALQDRVARFGGGVAVLYKELTGDDPTDEEIGDIFDPERTTKQFDDLARQAEIRGRPFAFGLGIRSVGEFDKLEAMGVTADEAASRYQGVAQNADRTARLGAIESLISQGLPGDFGSNFGTTENSLLIRGLVLQDQSALAQLQNIAMREVARFKVGGTPVGQQGQLTGLLSGAERSTFG